MPELAGLSDPIIPKGSATVSPVYRCASRDSESTESSWAGRPGRTMARHVLNRHRTVVVCATLLTISIAVASLHDHTGNVAAAPHLVGAKDHPFDPDWPAVQLIILQKCAGCHRPGTDRVDLSTYDSIMAGITEDEMRVVTPGRPRNSVLWDYVAWNADARRDSRLPSSPMMPEERAEWLTMGQIQTIERWITRGALQFQLPPTCSVRPLMETDFPSAKQCKACHPNQYNDWSRSMHHYAQSSPIYMAFNLTLQERTGGTIGTFCTRCHTPVGTELGENGLLRNIHRSQISMEGVTCVVCHRRIGKHNKSNARIALQPGQVLDTCIYGPFDDSPSTNHPNKANPFMKTSAFCGACHDVTSPQGLRLEEAFSEWQNSPAAKAGQTCQSCHMGPVPGVPIPDHKRPLGYAAIVPGQDENTLPKRHLTDHTFAGPDYSLLPDTEFPEKLDWMYEVDYRNFDKLTPYQQKTLTELRRKNRGQLEIARKKRLQLLRNAARICVNAPPHARPGHKLHVRVDVTSTTAGHSFPTGFTAERQAWVQLTVSDPAGKLIFASGNLDHNGDLRDGHSHEVEAGKLARDKFLLNFQNKFMATTAVGTDRTVVLSINRHLQPVNVVRPARGIAASYGRPESFRIAKGSLPPLATMGRTYPIRLPNIPGNYVVDVRLNWRHLPPTLLDAVGMPHLKQLLEIVVIDSRRFVVQVSSAPPPTVVPLR